MQQLDIYGSDPEVSRLAEVLTRDGLAHINKLSGGRDQVHSITAKGVDYCEEDSFSQPGTPVIHLTFNGSANGSNFNLGSTLHNITQSAGFTNNKQELIARIKDNIETSAEITAEEKEELIECVNDIEEKIKSKKAVSKYQWSTLIGNTAKLMEVGKLALELAQASGFVPTILIP